MNEQALQALKGLAEKLGQRLEVLWPMAVRYVVVEGFVSLATWGFVLPIVTVLLARRGGAQQTVPRPLARHRGLRLHRRLGFIPPPDPQP
jgi:hypothetical protein